MFPSVAQITTLFAVLMLSLDDHVGHILNMIYANPSKLIDW